MSVESSTLEEFRLVVGIEMPWYRISNLGRVQTCRIKGAWKGQTGEWKDLKLKRLKKNGHTYVAFSLAGKSMVRYVHRLVLEAFVGPCPNGMEACHFPDRDPSNNRLTNLRWDTHVSNMRDKLTHGTSNKGSQNAMAIVTEEIVSQIKSKRRAGARICELVREFKLKRAHIQTIANGHRWRHVA